jgi:hypothetical protein
MTTDLPVGRNVYCYFCDDPVVALADAMTITVPEYPRNSLWAHADCVAEREFDANLRKPRYVVVVYDCDREMGGQEEGGWSFETGQRVLDADFTSLEAAEMVRAGLEIEYPYTGQRGWYSKQGPDYSVRLYDRHTDAEFADVFDERLDVISFYPVTRPHFE